MSHNQTNIILGYVVDHNWRDYFNIISKKIIMYDKDNHILKQIVLKTDTIPDGYNPYQYPQVAKIELYLHDDIINMVDPENQILTVIKHETDIRTCRERATELVLSYKVCK